MWRMLQQPAPDDYVVATGKTHSVREFAELAFACAGLDTARHVTVDPAFFRPAEVNLLVGDPAKARARLGWRHTVTFQRLVREMVEADCRLLGVAHLLPRRAEASVPMETSP
jgi:GDPmannose 4,6-dehydratase